MSTIWEQNLEKLTAFKRDHGHTNVPKNYTDEKLARLVVTLRYQKRKGTLTADKELDLYKLGFDFEPHKTQWNKMYEQVIEFFKLNGFKLPSRRSSNDFERSLADWVHRMHKLIRTESLDIEQTHKLALLNIDGNPKEYRLTPRGFPKKFENMLNRLKQYQQQNGKVLTQHMADPVLYQWIMVQKARIEAATISPVEFSALLKTDLSIQDEQVNKTKSSVYLLKNGS
jgi:hypothetical protein